MSLSREVPGKEIGNNFINVMWDLRAGSPHMAIFPYNFCDISFFSNENIWKLYADLSYISNTIHYADQ